MEKQEARCPFLALIAAGKGASAPGLRGLEAPRDSEVPSTGFSWSWP